MIYFHSLYFQYYAESHAVIYMVDSSDSERMTESKQAFGVYFKDEFGQRHWCPLICK